MQLRNRSYGHCTHDTVGNKSCLKNTLYLRTMFLMYNILEIDMNISAFFLINRMMRVKHARVRALLNLKKWVFPDFIPVGESLESWGRGSPLFAPLPCLRRRVQSSTTMFPFLTAIRPANKNIPTSLFSGELPLLIPSLCHGLHERCKSVVVLKLCLFFRKEKKTFFLPYSKEHLMQNKYLIIYLHLSDEMFLSP